MILPDDQAEQPLDLTRRSVASKKMRMTLACVRCRSKKVKCDFAHPSCTRCAQAKTNCSYEGSSTQVDLFNIVKLNDIVGTLQQRVQTLEATISDINQSTQSITNDMKAKEHAMSSNASKQQGETEPQHQWTLSLTPTGLRIDTNVVDLPNLYDILLSGVSQLDLNQASSHGATTVSSSASSSSEAALPSLSSSSSILNVHQDTDRRTSFTATDGTVMVTRKTPLWRSRLRTFPLYSTWNSTRSPNMHHDHLPSSPLYHHHLSHPSHHPHQHQHQHQQHHHHHHQQQHQHQHHEDQRHQEQQQLLLLEQQQQRQGQQRQQQQQQQQQHQEYSLASISPAKTSVSSLEEMINIYSECFLCLPDTGYGGTVSERYHLGTLDPLLTNAIFSWAARHGAVYHNLFPGQDPNEVGECYFGMAKNLLKDRFMIPTIDTLHGLLIMYIYAIGRPNWMNGEENDASSPRSQRQQGSAESEAYIFLGLAIRMCLDLKLHEERKSVSKNEEEEDDGHDGDDGDDDDNDSAYGYDNNCGSKDVGNGDNGRKKDYNTKRVQMERYRRLFWVLYFLETLCALHSDKPFSLPSEEQITVDYPEVLDHEIGEHRWRTEFMMKRFRITRIYRNIIQRTAQERLLVSSISELDASLGNWYNQLPPHLQYKKGDFVQRNWRSTSFREQACIKLNFEYHFQRCQLYAVFLTRQKTAITTTTGNNGSNSNDGDHDETMNDNSTDDSDPRGENVSSSMERMAKEICITSATMTAELMQCWNQLQQRWCHFSLESLMMAVNIFEMLLKDPDHVAQATTHLNTMLAILQASPIQHHRYVILVMTRIRQLLRPLQYQNQQNSQDLSDVMENATSSFAELDDELQKRQQQEQRLNYQRQQQEMQEQLQQQQQRYDQESHQRYTQHQQGEEQQHVYSSQSLLQEQQRQEEFSAVESLHPHSHQLANSLHHQSMDFYTNFRMQKTDAMMGASLSDLPFSDFLYNPVMDIPSPFGSYNISSGSLPPPLPPPVPTSSSSSSSLPHNNSITTSSSSVTATSASLLPSAKRSSSVADTSMSSPSSSSSSSSSTSASSPIPTSLIAQRLQVPAAQPVASSQEEFSDSASSLWTTLHQPTYASNGSVSYDYIPTSVPMQDPNQHQHQIVQNDNEHPYHDSCTHNDMRYLS